MRANLIDKGYGMAYTKGSFPDGEPWIKLEIPPVEKPEFGVIKTRITNSDDLILLLQATQLMRRKTSDVRLELTYLMGQRNDRVMSDMPFTLDIVADIINSQNYSFVRIHKPHSDVSLGMIKNAHPNDWVSYYYNAIVRNNTNGYKDACLISPDAGAYKNTEKIAVKLNLDVVIASKRRDVETGKLSGIKIHADSLEGKECFVVDDLGDGFGTFIGIAEELKRLGAKRRTLIVYHAIQGEGIVKACEVYDRVVITNSYSDWKSEGNLEVVNVCQ
jgi:ribose-phosphate pyrophosphokinase